VLSDLSDLSYSCSFEVLQAVNSFLKSAIPKRISQFDKQWMYALNDITAEVVLKEDRKLGYKSLFSK
jgi:hypothetical protein